MWPYLRYRPPRCQRRCWRGLRRLRPVPRPHRAGLSPDAYALLSHLTRTGVSRTAFGPPGQKPHNIAPLFSHMTFPQSWRLPDDRCNSSVGVAKRVRTYNHLPAATYRVFASYFVHGCGRWTAVRRHALTGSPAVPRAAQPTWSDDRPSGERSASAPYFAAGRPGCGDTQPAINHEMVTLGENYSTHRVRDRQPYHEAGCRKETLTRPVIIGKVTLRTTTGTCRK